MHQTQCLSEGRDFTFSYFLLFYLLLSGTVEYNQTFKDTVQGSWWQRQSMGIIESDESGIHLLGKKIDTQYTNCHYLHLNGTGWKKKEKNTETKQTYWSHQRLYQSIKYGIIEDHFVRNISIFGRGFHHLFTCCSQVKADVETHEQVWRSDLYLSSGILGLGVLALLALTSLPSVGNALNWREFTFVQVRFRMELRNPWGLVKHRLYSFQTWAKYLHGGQVVNVAHFNLTQ